MRSSCDGTGGGSCTCSLADAQGGASPPMLLRPGVVDCPVMEGLAVVSVSSPLVPRPPRLGAGNLVECPHGVQVTSLPLHLRSFSVLSSALASWDG